MIKKITAFVLIVAAVMGCNSGETKTPNTDIEVATTFIRAILDNDFKTAPKYILNDTANSQFFNTFKQNYQSLDKSELEKYKAAQILINNREPLNDSVTIIKYSNTYKKDKETNLKLIRKNYQWLIDFKYTFEGQ